MISMSGIVISKDRTGDGFYTGILISLLRLANNSALCLMNLNGFQLRNTGFHFAGMAVSKDRIMPNIHYLVMGTQQIK